VAVNRTELVEAVATKAELEKPKADMAVKAVIETVISQMRAGEKVSVFGFGTFKPTSRTAHMARNPQTGEPVKVGASKNVRFTAATAFKSALNIKGSSKKAAPAKKAGKAAAPAKKVSTAKKAPAKPAAAKTAVAKASPAKKATPVAKAAATKATAIAKTAVKKATAIRKPVSKRAGAAKKK